MAWTDLVERANAAVIDTFQSTTNPTASLSPAAGGGPYTLPTVEREVSTQERTSSGNVTSLFFDSIEFAPTTSAPIPKIGDSITWQGVGYRIQSVQMDSEKGFSITMRKA